MTLRVLLSHMVYISRYQLKLGLGFGMSGVAEIPAGQMALRRRIRSRKSAQLIYTKAGLRRCLELSAMFERGVGGS